MSLVVPNTAEILMLKYILNFATTDGTAPTSAGNRKLRLYTNNLTPDNTTVLSAFTECSASGYTNKTITGTNWTINTSVGMTTATYSEQAFDFDVATTIYGYYVTTSGGSPELLWAERFPATYTLPSGGGRILLTLKVTLD